MSKSKVLLFVNNTLNVGDYNKRNTFLTSKLLKQGYRVVVKYNIGFKTLLHQGLSEHVIYGDIVY